MKRSSLAVTALLIVSTSGCQGPRASPASAQAPGPATSAPGPSVYPPATLAPHRPLSAEWTAEWREAPEPTDTPQVAATAAAAEASASAGAIPSLPELPSLPAVPESDAPPASILLDAFGPVAARHFVDLTESEYEASRRRRDAEDSIARERTRGRWFAALVGESDGGIPFVRATFADHRSLERFASHPDTIIESWVRTSGEPPAAGPGGIDGRRLRASDLTRLRRADALPPTIQVAVYRDPASRTVHRDRLVFGSAVAAADLERKRAYRRHQESRRTARAILHARNRSGVLDAGAQWRALQQAVQHDRFPLRVMPGAPTGPADVFLAVEFEVDDRGRIERPTRLHRSSGIAPLVVGGVKVLALHGDGEGDSLVRQALPFTVGEDGETLVPAPHPMAGRDAVEMRILDPAVPDPRAWNRLEFGAPHVVREKALADMGLLQGHLERKQKQRALKKAGLDLLAEPVIAGLNIGGGLAAVDAPIGEGARLVYNTTVIPFFLGRAPAPEAYPGILRDLATATGESTAALEDRLSPYLDPADIESLTRELGAASPTAIEDALRMLAPSDIEAATRLARRRNADERYRWSVDTLASAAKVTGESESGTLKSIFNNSWLSPNGELSLKNSLAIAAGRDDLTPRSGISLDSLASGGGPSSAWWQFLDFSIDLRAVANSLALLVHRDRPDRELFRPFPHGMVVSDLAAYEVRFFGFPALLFHKRRLARDDAAAFRDDYAYGVIGATIVEHFPSQADFDEEMSAGRMFPLGFVEVKDSSGSDWPTNLPVFGHRITTGRHAGRTSLVLYGLEAFHAYADLMEREHARLFRFEAALDEGGVIEQLVVPDKSPRGLPPATFEPGIHPGAAAVNERFHALLDDLLECDRFLRLSRWGVALDPADEAELNDVRRRLEARGVRLPADGSSPLVHFDATTNRIRHLVAVDGHALTREVTLVPSPAEIARDVERSEDARRLERLRRSAIVPGAD